MEENTEYYNSLAYKHDILFIDLQIYLHRYRRKELGKDRAASRS